MHTKDFKLVAIYEHGVCLLFKLKVFVHFLKIVTCQLLSRPLVTENNGVCGILGVKCSNKLNHYLNNIGLEEERSIFRQSTTFFNGLFSCDLQK